jgi:DNA-binding transcriptional ArsR family regulator
MRKQGSGAIVNSSSLGGIVGIFGRAIYHAAKPGVLGSIYTEMLASECPLNCSNFRKIDNRTLPKATLSQHFKILREAGLIRSERKGVAMHNTNIDITKNNDFRRNDAIILGPVMLIRSYRSFLV